MKLPDNWHKRPLGEIFKKIVVGYVGNVNDHYCDASSGIPFYRTLNIRDGYFRHDEIRHVTTEFNDKNKKSQIENDDIVIARVGANLGMVCKVSGLNGMANMANAIIIKSKSAKNTSPDFYTYFLLSSYGKSQIYAGAAGGAQGVFNTKLTQEISVPVPPLPEQKKIAKILSTWDQAISTTEQLLANSQQQKKALMQQLLTGKKRLLDKNGVRFSGEWEKFKFGSLFSERVEIGRDDLPLLSITADDGVVYQEDTGRKNTSNEDKSKYRRICVNDIGYNTMRMWQGRSSLSNREGIVSPAYTIVTPNSKIEPLFAAYLFKFPELVHVFYRHSQGLVSDTWNLKFSHFKKISWIIPIVEEQQKIASVLSAADQEITILQRKLDCLKQEKKALMQALLTGKRRVVLEAAHV